MMPTDNDLDLTSFGSAQAIQAKPKLLCDVADRLRLGDMPPKDAPQPSQAEREQLLGWSQRRAAAIAAVAAEEQLNATYLTALWAGEGGPV